MTKLRCPSPRVPYSPDLAPSDLSSRLKAFRREIEFWGPAEDWGVPRTASGRIALRCVPVVKEEAGPVYFTRRTLFWEWILLILFEIKNRNFKNFSLFSSFYTPLDIYIFEWIKQFFFFHRRIFIVYLCKCNNTVESYFAKKKKVYIYIFNSRAVILGK